MNGPGAPTFVAAPGMLSFNTTIKGRHARPRGLLRGEQDEKTASHPDCRATARPTIHWSEARQCMPLGPLSVPSRRPLDNPRMTACYSTGPISMGNRPDSTKPPLEH